MYMNLNKLIVFCICMLIISGLTYITQNQFVMIIGVIVLIVGEVIIDGFF